MLSDLKYAFRQLLKYPGFSIFALLTLALGIGANTATFSVINSVLLSALPVKDPQELVFLTDPNDNGLRGGIRSGNRDFLGYAEFQNLREHNAVFSDMLAVSSSLMGSDVVVSNVGQPDAHGGAIISMVSGNYFSVLGVNAMLGRIFAADVDKVPGANPVVVISYDFWQERFGGDLGVLGRKIQINGTAYDIIGVAQRGFSGETVGWSTGVWAPLSMQTAIQPGNDLLALNANPLRNFRWLQVIGRLKPGVTVTQAKTNVEATFQQFLESQLPAVAKDRQRSFLDQHLALTRGTHGGSILRKEYTEPLIILMALVGLLLLSACANLANLSLARATRRQKEIAVRVAIGAKPSRIFRQLLVESLLLSVVGGAFGLVLAQWCSSLLLQLVAQRDLKVHSDAHILLFALGVSLAVGIIFGTAPALQASRVNLNAVLKGIGDGAAKIRSGSMSKVLVIAQIALSLPLLIVAGLFVHSFQKLATVDLGYDETHLLLLRPNYTGYKGAAVGQFYQELIDRIRVIPGVRGATLSANGLFTGNQSSYRISIDGYAPTQGQDMQPDFDHVGPGYFSTVGIPVLLGREIGPQDSVSGQRVGLINQTMARYYFGDSNPIGRRITVNLSTAPDAVTAPSFLVVGVVADAKYNTVRGQTPRLYYVPFYNPLGPSPYLENPICIVRTTGDPSAMIAALRSAIKETAPNSLPPTIIPVDQMINRTLGLDRLLTGCSSCFGALATVLVCIGIYGIISYAVVRRTREIGIRIAIGAQRGNVLRLMMGESLGLVLIGVIIGIPIAIAGDRFVSGFLFGLTPADPLALAAATGLMVGVAALASFFPSLRATRVDPMIALRAE